MERAFRKYVYMLLVVPMIFLISGCNAGNLAGLLPNSEAGLEMTEDVIPPPITVNNDTNKVNTKNDADNKKEEKEKEKTIKLSDNNTVLSIDAGGRNTPFVPYRERNLSYSSMNFGDLPLPPAGGVSDEDLSGLITAKVTGILYDDASPSAIINVLNDDYLVKPGDKVETFEISAIKEDYVAIKTGTNVYRAKVGDIVDGEMYGTGVYNLGHRFAGVNNPSKDEDILIVQTKKKEGSSDKGQPKSINDLSLPPVPETLLPTVKLKTQAGEIPLPLGNSTATPKIDETN